ncbi:hypothetical protein [Candidatus Binatus soli]|jgi:hypothetical protein|uniref:hypothetical protein n=1 Tax=Candidatus Binatus soli TaxID=1953413 RepID=UPI003D1147A6
MKRHPNGTWRGARQPVVVSEAVLRARWVEAETIHLKRMGLSFDAIAEQITRVGRRQAQAIVTIADGVTFPPDFQISRQACHKAFKKAVAREPSLAVRESRKLDSARCEEMFLNLQPGIRKGNPRSIEAGVKVLRHTAQINGYAAPQRHKLTAKDRGPVTILDFLKLLKGKIPDGPSIEVQATPVVDTPPIAIEPPAYSAADVELARTILATKPRDEAQDGL